MNYFRSFALTVSPASEQAISRKLLRYCCGTPYAGRDRDTVGSVLGLLPPWLRDDTPVPETTAITQVQLRSVSSDDFLHSRITDISPPYTWAIQAYTNSGDASERVEDFWWK